MLPSTDIGHPTHIMVQHSKRISQNCAHWNQRNPASDEWLAVFHGGKMPSREISSQIYFLTIIKNYPFSTKRNSLISSETKDGDSYRQSSATVKNLLHVCPRRHIHSWLFSALLLLTKCLNVLNCQFESLFLSVYMTKYYLMWKWISKAIRFK